MSKKVFQAYSEEYQELDLEELDMPRYVEELERPSKEKKSTISHIVEDVWVPKPELVEKSLEELEKQDELYRKRISQHSDQEKIKSQQLNLQRTMHMEILELGIKLHQLPTFCSVPEYKQKLEDIFECLLQLQKNLSPISVKSKDTIEKDCLKIWDWLAGLARDWSHRVDLKIGADIIEQVMREAEKKTDFDIQVHLLREMKNENVFVRPSGEKKAKHKFSKHRKLKFDVHEKLQNFMVPEYSVWDTKQENLLKSLFGKKIEAEEKVYLDIPLV